MNFFKKRWPVTLRWGIIGIIGLALILPSLACKKEEEDILPPTVEITHPADGDTVSGYVTIIVKAIDEDSVESITLLIDGSKKDEVEATTLSYEWNTLQLEHLSTHTIYATSLDHAGNAGTSDTISVIVSHVGQRPAIPALTGPSKGVQGDTLTFKATTTDPNDDNISFQFDWGDGSGLEWTDYVASGDTITVKHAYDSVGNYEVRVKARDVHGAYSEYSDPLVVEIIPPTIPGSIQVNSVPVGAEIWLDGSSTGEITPALLEDILPGGYTVALRLEGYADYDTTVAVFEGQMTVVSATLEDIGELVWRYKTGGEILSSPAISSGGTIYVGSSDNKLHAVTSEGDPAGDFSTEFAVKSSPAVAADGKIYFGSDDVYIYALWPEIVMYWDYKTEGYVSSSPAIGSDGTIYVGSGDDNLWALESDGDFIWKYTTGGDVASSPAIGTDGTIFVGSDDNYLYAINPDQSLKWSYPTGASVSSSPAIGSDGTIYFGSQDRYVYALNPANGSEKWSYRTDGKVNSSPAIGEDGTVYVGSDDNHLYALNPADGGLKWKYETGGFVRSSPAVGADGTIYFGSIDGYIYALRSDGTLKWRYATGDRIITSSPAIGSDGTIYGGSTDTYLYALSSDSYGLASSAWPKFCRNNRNTGRAGD
jgi:outer membrane protein assembly factor BamB